MKRIQVLVLAIMIGALAVFGGCNSDTGEICSLEKAYEQGLLDQEAMQSIADYWNSNTVCPEELSSKTEKKIKKAYLQWIDPPAKPDIDKVHIIGYYGNYNEYIVVRMTDDYRAVDVMVYPEYKFGDVIFYDYFGFFRVWTE